jgi:hypothetical protein
MNFVSKLLMVKKKMNFFMTQATTNTLKNNTKFDWNKLIMKIKELAFYFHL